MKITSQKGFTVVEALVSVGILAMVIGVVMTIFGDYYRTANRNYKAMSERVLLTQVSSQLYSPVSGFPIMADKSYVSCFLKNASGTSVINPQTNVLEPGFIAVGSYDEKSASICSKEAEIEVHVTASSRSGSDPGVRYYIEVFQIVSFSQGGLMKKYSEEINLASGL
ncbi:MAG: prepilin-type N-terminal cleavage/methylation domain-containing protein [bacterium]